MVAGELLNSALFFIFFFTPAVIAVSVIFWAWLAALLTAFGNRQWFWGIAVLVLLPLALPYSLIYRETASYPRRLLLGALALLLLPLAYAALNGWFAAGSAPSLLPVPASR